MCKVQFRRHFPLPLAPTEIDSDSDKEDLDWHILGACSPAPGPLPPQPQQAQPQMQAQAEDTSNSFCMQDSLMELWNAPPHPFAMWDMVTSEWSSESESEPVSAPQSKRHRSVAKSEVTEANAEADNINADDETDHAFFLKPMVLQARKMAADHHMANRILWDCFDTHTGHTLCESVASILCSTPLLGYVGICSTPLERFALMGDASHHHRYQFMTVLAASDRVHLSFLEKHVIVNVRDNHLSILNRSKGGERIRDKFVFFYVCYSFTNDASEWR